MLWAPSSNTNYLSLIALAGWVRSRVVASAQSHKKKASSDQTGRREVANALLAVARWEYDDAPRGDDGDTTTARVHSGPRCRVKRPNGGDRSDNMAFSNVAVVARSGVLVTSVRDRRSSGASRRQGGAGVLVVPAQHRGAKRP